MLRQNAMLVNGAGFLRGIGQRASRPIRPSLRKPDYNSRQFHTHRATDQGQHEAPRSKWTLFDKFKIYIWICGGGQALITFAYEPLRDDGLFDNIAERTIGYIIPPKIVEAPNAASGTLYKPITRDGEIRLLTLEPGAPGDEIECYLIHVQQSWRTRYEALSYAWGDASITRPLRCSGRIVNVHASLYNALSDLRHPTNKRTLWVDALCINQADNDEKSKQVDLMAKIYSGARQVLIYLGKSDPSVERALESIDRLDRKFKFSYGTSDLAASVSFLGMSPADAEKISWDQIINLLLRPWFRRTWVIQETVLAKRGQVFCGNQSISWAKLQRVMIGMNRYHCRVREIPGYESIKDVHAGIFLIDSARIAHHPQILMPDQWLIRQLRKGNRIFEHAEKAPELLDLILDTRSFLCTNPSDKVFGMLGMAKQGKESIQSDYTISPGDVFRKFALREILHNGSLRVLGSSSDKAGSQFPSPSWVPDFSRLDAYDSLTGAHNRDRFNASGDMCMEASISHQDTVLHLKGRIVDTLHTVGERSASGLDPLLDKDSHLNHGLQWARRLQSNKDMIEEARDIWLAAAKRSTRALSPVPEAGEIMVLREKSLSDPAYVPSGWELGDSAYVPPSWKPFLETLVCSRTNQWIQIDDGTFSEWVASFVRLTLQGTQTPLWYVKSHRLEAAWATEAFMSRAKSRRFAGTDTGLIGYVPMRAKKGDLVCILYGAQVPFVLRKTTGGSYSLVGECYMNGIMYGEALEMADVKDEDVVFNIV